MACVCLGGWLEYVCVDVKDKAELVEKASLWPAEGVHGDVRVGSNGVAVQPRNDSVDILTSDILLNIFTFLYAVLALYWQFQYYFVVEPFSLCSSRDPTPVDSLPLGS